mmetsp:Transcript_13381/g.27731  ORF Transcript_13381/g.27731 Transcript_13381/m.27731 type:complete len:98 (-) Transcript_13381:311-604(-)
MHLAAEPLRNDEDDTVCGLENEEEDGHPKGRKGAALMKPRDLGGGNNGGIIKKLLLLFWLEEVMVTSPCCGTASSLRKMGLRELRGALRVGSGCRCC